MTTGPKGIALIKKFELFVSHPYLCPAGVPTIGYGTTYYIGGAKVTLHDSSISEAQATALLMAELGTYERAVNTYVQSKINQNQFDALVSFSYNLGTGALKGSHLLIGVNHDPCLPQIRDEFMKWTHAGGHVLAGLVARRKAEADLYFS